MPLFDIENPTTGAIITVEHPQAPTQAEAAQIISMSSGTLPEVVVTAEGVKDPAGTGQFLEQSQPLGALARGALSTLTANLSEALPNRGADLSAFDPASPQFTNPYSTAIGEIAGGFLPLGELIKGAQGAKTLGQAVLANAKTGARFGGLYGAAGGAAESAAQPDIDTQQALENIFMGTALGIPAGAAIGGALPLASGIIKEVPAAVQGIGKAIPEAVQTAEEAIAKAKARTAPATVQQNAIAALDFTPEQVDRHIPIVSERVTQITGKVPNTAKEAIDAMKKTADTLYDERLEINNAATEQGLVAKGDMALQAANDIIAPLTTLKAREKKAILDNLKELYAGDKTIKEGHKIQRDLNDKFSAAYENGTISRADPAFQAEKAIRDSFADQMDDITRSITGRAESPYSDIGSLIEVRGALHEKRNKIIGNIAERKTGIDKTPSRGIPLTKFQAKATIVDKVLTPFQKDQLERLDDTIPKIFARQGANPPPIPLEQLMINQIRQQFSPTQGVQSLQSIIQPTPAAPNPAFLAAVKKLGVNPNSPQGQMLMQGLQNAQVIPARP